jgi:hypothetical protein
MLSSQKIDRVCGMEIQRQARYAMVVGDAIEPFDAQLVDQDTIDRGALRR